RHVIFFVSLLPNSTHVFKSTSAKLKKHRKKTHPQEHTRFTKASLDCRKQLKMINYIARKKKIPSQELGESRI
ncbi:MAG: hypothetical protein ACI9SQ_000993, partial [Rubritalea sp.]